MPTTSCRSCGSKNLEPVIDLGDQPLANNLLQPADLGKPEPTFPLGVSVCPACWLMQITHIVPPVTLFSDYVYFSSFSEQMLRHAREASMLHIEEMGLDTSRFVVEVASNDGYLLKNFVAAGVPCLGIEPAANIAETARANGVPTDCEFFGEKNAIALRERSGPADLILGNNVFAHAPEPNDFVAGIAALLKPHGRAVLEFPYGVEMIDNVEFDTIYHEHVFYYTLTPLVPLFARHGLEVFHVAHLPIHGGSLRLFVGHRGVQPVRTSVAETLDAETAAGVSSKAYYARFSERAEKVKSDLIAFLTDCSISGQSVAAYGASAKGSTLLNFVGAPASSIGFIADRSTHKHGKLSPGIHLPIVPAEELKSRQPDYAVLLTWNFADEILAQQSAYRDAGGKFVIPLPTLSIS